MSRVWIPIWTYHSGRRIAALHRAATCVPLSRCPQQCIVQGEHCIVMCRGVANQTYTIQGRASRWQDSISINRGSATDTSDRLDSQEAAKVGTLVH